MLIALATGRGRWGASQPGEERSDVVSEFAHSAPPGSGCMMLSKSVPLSEPQCPCRPARGWNGDL